MEAPFAFAGAGIQELSFGEIDLVGGAINWGAVVHAGLGGALAGGSGGAAAGAVGGLVLGGPGGAIGGAFIGAATGALGGLVEESVREVYNQYTSE
jgi:hypothetical protein